MDLHKTRDELILEAADKLKIVGTGQSLEAEYASKLEGSIDPLLMQLASDGICEVVNTNYIPAEWFDALAGLLANIQGQLGGAAFSPQVKEFYEMQLKRLTSTRPSYSILEAEYF